MLNDILIFIFTEIFGTKIMYIITMFMIFYLYIKKKHKHSIEILFLFALMTLSVTYLKDYFSIERPDNALIEITGYAFPSGHAAGSIFLFIIIYYYFVRKLEKRTRVIWITIFTILTLLIGGSRVYLQVHTPIQVLAGFIVGAFWPILYFYISSLKNPPA